VKVNATSSSFIDAIANALGVLIIVTLLLVLLSQYFAHKQEHQDKDVVNGQRTKVEHGRDMRIGTLCRKTIIRPWSKEYIVLSDRVVPLNKKAISEAFIMESRKNFGEISEGEWTIFLRKNIDRDIDTFELEFVPNSKAIETKYPVWLTPELETKVDEELLAGLHANSILFFFVYPSGMELFASLYPHLIQQSVLFQAVYQPSSAYKVILWRDSEQFDTFEVDYHC